MRIFLQLEREQIEELDNQKWLEKSIIGPNMNLKQRLNSRSSRSTNQSASQSDSSSVKSGRSGNHINSLERNNSRKSLERSSSVKAPAKPPRSTRNSSSSSSIRKEKSISDDSNSSSRNNSLDKRIIAVQERIILHLIENYSLIHRKCDTLRFSNSIVLGIISIKN